MAYASIFERLSRTETVASAKKREANAEIRYRLSSPAASATGSTRSSRTARSYQTTSSRLTTQTAPANPDLFNRLAYTETYASAQMKGKIEKPETKTSTARTSNAFFDRLSKTETFASATMKGRSVTAPAATTSNSSSKKTSNAFFNRMTYTDTFASASMKNKRESDGSSAPVQIKHKNNTPSSSVSSLTTANTSKNKTKKRTTNRAFFSRMAESETFATATMKGKIETIPTDVEKAQEGRKKTRSSRKVSSSFFDRLSKCDTKSSQQKKKSLEEGGDDGRPSTAFRRPSSAQSFRSQRSNRSISSRSVNTTNTAKQNRSRRSFFSKKKSFTSVKDTSPSTAKAPSRRSMFSRKKSQTTPSSRANEINNDSNMVVTSILRPSSIRVKPTTPNSKPKPKPKPVERQVLKFDSEDDLSFGDDSGDDEIEDILSDSGKNKNSEPLETPSPEHNPYASLQDTGPPDTSPRGGEATQDLLDMPNDDEIVPVSESQDTVEDQEENNEAADPVEVQDLLSMDVVEPAENTVPAGNPKPYSSSDLLGMEDDNLPPPQDQQQQQELNDDNKSDVVLQDLSYGLSVDDEEEERKDDEEKLTEDDPALTATITPEDSYKEFDEEEKPSESYDSDQTPRDSYDDEDDDEEEEFPAGYEQISEAIIEPTQQETKYKILCSDKYHPEKGMQVLDPHELNVIDALLLHEAQGCSNEELAVAMIEALFRRDFKDGEKWEVDPGTARELEEDEGGGGELDGRAFVTKQQARWDDEDVYSVAAAKGTVTIWPEENEVRMENYSYFVAG